MKQKKQIDCQLNCKATASLSLEVLNDLNQEDRPIASIINDERSEDDDEVKNNQNPST
jgi:hypothetical protein